MIWKERKKKGGGGMRERLIEMGEEGERKKDVMTR